jgi:hypothetical protein
MRNESEGCECTTVGIWLKSSTCNDGEITYREIEVVCDDCRLDEEWSKAEAAANASDQDEIRWVYPPQLDTEEN